MFHWLRRSFNLSTKKYFRIVTFRAFCFAGNNSHNTGAKQNKLKQQQMDKKDNKRTQLIKKLTAMCNFPKFVMYWSTTFAMNDGPIIQPRKHIFLFQSTVQWLKQERFRLLCWLVNTRLELSSHISPKRPLPVSDRLHLTFWSLTARLMFELYLYSHGHSKVICQHLFTRGCQSAACCPPGSRSGRSYRLLKAGPLVFWSMM